MIFITSIEEKFLFGKWNYNNACIVIFNVKFII